MLHCAFDLRNARCDSIHSELEFLVINSWNLASANYVLIAVHFPSKVRRLSEGTEAPREKVKFQGVFIICFFLLLFF